MISTWFERVRGVPILDVISYLGTSVNVNGKANIRCGCILPDHVGPNKTGRAFCIDTSRNIWFCHGCKKGGGNIELVQAMRGGRATEAGNFIAERAHFETFEEVRASSPEVRQRYREQFEEQKKIGELFIFASHYFHSKLTSGLRKNLLIPQGKFDPKESWKNLYETWGFTDDLLEENLVGYDDNGLLQAFRAQKYSDETILSSGFFYRNDDGSIGDSVFKTRLVFPCFEMGRVVNFIARSTSHTWPCYTDDPTTTLAGKKYPYTKYKKIPLYHADSRPYVSQAIKFPLCGLDELRQKKNGAVVEGITDILMFRSFFKVMQQAGVQEASKWGVAAFISNQISENHVQSLAQAAKNMDTLLFLCDSEISQRGDEGAICTAKKMLGQGLLPLIGFFPLPPNQQKIDPAEWIKNRRHDMEQNPQGVWEEFSQIVRQAKNVIEVAMERSAAAIVELGKEVSLSYRNNEKNRHIESILELIALLPEIQQDDYLNLLTKPPFNHQISKLKRLLKTCQDQTTSTHQENSAISHTGFSIAGVIPNGWGVQANGMYKEVITRSGDTITIKIAEAPMLIAEKHYDIDTGQYYLKAMFYERHHWVSRIENRKIFMSSRSLPNLAEWGFPTNSENAKDLVKFLTEYEAVNRDTISVSQVVSSCGNKEINGENAFVLGKRCIYKNREETIEFLTPDHGEIQIVNAFESAGNLSTWVQMAKKCLPYSGVMLALYTSFTGPYLAKLKAKGFGVHVWGKSSIGKTITLMLCASAWGDPIRLIQSWNQKEVAVERRMALCNEVGIFLDELKQAIRREDVEKTLYAVTNGYGRARGSLKGTQKTLYWILPLLSTGEMPATQTSSDEGGQVRVINVRGHLFGEGNRELVKEIEFLAKNHYGLAGPYFIQHADEDEIMKRFRYYQEKIAKLASSDIACRLGDNLAVILAIGDEVNSKFQLTEKESKYFVGDLVQELLQDASTIDRCTSALGQVIEWASANEGTFYPHTEFKKDISGLWKEGEYIAFYPYKLQEILEKFGYNYEAILRDWAERGWIRTEGKNRTCRFMINNRRVRLVSLKWEFLNLT